MRRLLRNLRRLLTGMGIVLLMVAAVVTGILWLALPPRSQQARIPGLSGAGARRLRRRRHPAHPRRQRRLDAAAALGFVHARDRMFQMDLMRRAASGRLSEIAGRATLRLDRTMRTLGLRRAPRPTRRAAGRHASGAGGLRARGERLDPRRAGASARRSSCCSARPSRGPPSIACCGARPWDCGCPATGARNCRAWRWPASCRAEKIDELWPPDRRSRPAGGAAPMRICASPTRRAGLLRVTAAFPAPFTLPSTASNEWAVDGAHSATGAPLLAGDPHLAFGFPGIWYLARIETPGRRAGRRHRAGRAVHGAGPQRRHRLDLHHHRRRHAGRVHRNPGRRRPLPDAGRPARLRDARSASRCAASRTMVLTVRRNPPRPGDQRSAPGRARPVLAVADGQPAPGDTAATGLLALNQARTVAEAGKAAALITSPVQNLLVADRHDIGLFVTGRVPIRRAGDGAAPVPGAGRRSTTGPRWCGGDALAALRRPGKRAAGERQRAASRRPTFPVFLGRDWFGDWRARRIRDAARSAPTGTPSPNSPRCRSTSCSTYAAAVLPGCCAVPRRRGRRHGAGAAARLGRHA